MSSGAVATDVEDCRSRWRRLSSKRESLRGGVDFVDRDEMRIEPLEVAVSAGAREAKTDEANEPVSPVEAVGDDGRDSDARSWRI
jgi:hypothetical protein